MNIKKIKEARIVNSIIDRVEYYESTMGFQRMRKNDAHITKVRNHLTFLVSMSYDHLYGVKLDGRNTIVKKIVKKLLK